MTEKQNYDWLSPQQAVLLRPDTYVGALDATEEETAIIQADGTSKIIKYTLSPILLKIVDEVLVNALDCATRDSLLRNIKFTFNQTTGIIEVENDGDGIEIKLFKNTNRYVPSIIFSELHSGSNFQDEDTRFTGGRNGVGASCTNIWSVLFEVEVWDTKKRFFQRFKQNLTISEEPQITDMPSKTGKVRVRFLPDYKRLNISLEKDNEIINDLFRTRCFETAICTRTGVTVFFQGEKISSKPSDLLKLLVKCQDTVEERCGDPYGPGCTICIGWRNHAADYYGFVNGVRCDSGTITNIIRDRLLKCISEQIRKKQNVGVKPQTLKDVLSILCIARVPNPRFTSQAKSKLSTTANDLGFQVELTNKVGNKLMKLGIIDEILRRETDRELNTSLKKALVPKSKDVLIDKYDPALDCRKDPDNCTLILTEGDSAKAFVVAGVSAIGREKYGIFPLRGVPLNVTNLTVPKILENKEISNIFKILNVAPFSDGKGLRYGHVAITSDQDCDGTHICGLIINLLTTCLPEVLKKKPNFIKRIVTPLIKATHKRSNHQLSFFSKQDYEKWHNSVPESNDAWIFKYYKGLGTSTSKEARQIFKDLDAHSIHFLLDGTAVDTLGRFYDESKSNDRKQLLTSEYDSELCVDYTLDSCQITDFMLKEHVHFSHYMLYRALPSAIDGLTPSRRKVMFYFLQKKNNSEEKVAQAASGVAQKTLYLHGEVSLVETMVGLAQNHVGTNNIALLQPNGQFGSRSDKTSVHAAARYIHTCLDPIARYIFPTADEPVLEYRTEEGSIVEPCQYIPIIPMILINGAQGIGTGFATCVPCYSVHDVIDTCKALAQNQSNITFDLSPFYRGFNGSIESTSKSVLTHGVLSKDDSKNTVIITELPVSKWTDPFLHDLKALAEGVKTIKGLQITNVANMSTDTKVYIEIALSEENRSTSAEEVAKMLRLSTSIPTTYMYAFDASYSLKHYQSTEEIIQDHARARLELYSRRRLYQLDEIEKKIIVLEAKVKFINLIITGTISLSGLPKSSMIEAMLQHTLPALKTKNDVEGFDYLLNINVSAFTKEKISNLTNEMSACHEEKVKITSKTSEIMWLEELIDLESAYLKYEERHKSRIEEDEEPMKKAAKSKRSEKTTNPAARKVRRK